MNRRWLWMFVLALGPGLTIGLGVIGYGLSLQPPRYRVPVWDGSWIEPKVGPGIFQSFRALSREQDNVVIGETEPWPHKHPRANSYLLSKQTFSGDVEVSLTARFLRGRYLGCYLCYDPGAGNGYWLGTGHAEGEDPNQAYIKIVHEGEWEVMAQAPLEILPDRDYRLVFGRTGDKLWLAVDGQNVVEWSSGEFRSGHVQLRLHNAKVEIRDLSAKGSTVGEESSRIGGGETKGP